MHTVWELFTVEPLNNRQGSLSTIKYNRGFTVYTAALATATTTPLSVSMPLQVLSTAFEGSVSTADA